MPTAAIATAARGPRSSNAIRFAAYDTDKVEPLATEIGRLTFHAEVTQTVSSRKRNSAGCGSVVGEAAASTSAPAAIVATTWRRAGTGCAPHSSSLFAAIVIVCPRRLVRSWDPDSACPTRPRGCASPPRPQQQPTCPVELAPAQPFKCLV